MTKTRKSECRHTSNDEASSAVNATAKRARRRLLPAISSLVASIIVVAIWGGLHPSGVKAGAEFSVASSPDRLAMNDAQSPSADTGGPAIHFPEQAFDFGTVPQGTKVSHTFAVKNTGDRPLKLIRAKAS